MIPELPYVETKQTSDEILTGLVRSKVFEQKDYNKLLELTGLIPDKRQWLRFLYGFTFSLGTVFLLLGIILFFAWNWSDLSAYQKLILVEGIFISSGIFALITKGEKLAGQLSVTIMCVMTGVVFAVYGQIYQTGADNYRLFVSWSLLILIPVMITRFAPLWMFWIALMNLAIVLWITQTWFGYNIYLRIGLAVGCANFVLMLIWSTYIYSRCAETITRKPQWLELLFRLFIPVSGTENQKHSASEMQMWMFRLIYAIGLAWLTITLFQIIGRGTSYYYTSTGIVSHFRFLIILLYLMTVGLAQYLVQKILKDLFIYTLSVFSLCSLACVSFGKLINISSNTVWILSLFVIFLAAAVAHWLRRIQHHWRIDS